MELPAQRQRCGGAPRRGFKAPSRHLKSEQDRGGEEKDAVRISSQKGSGSLEVSDLTPPPSPPSYSIKMI